MDERECEWAPAPAPAPSSLLRTFLLLLLVSATWLLGLLAVNSDELAFHYLFAVFSCLQVGGGPTPPAGSLLRPALVKSWVACTAPSLKRFDPGWPRGSPAVSELPGETGPRRVSGHSRAHCTRSRHHKEPVVLHAALLRASPGPCPPVFLHGQDTGLCSATAGAHPPPDQPKSHSCPQGGVPAICSSHQGLPRKSIKDLPRRPRMARGQWLGWGPPGACRRAAQLPPRADAPVAMARCRPCWRLQPWCQALWTRRCTLGGLCSPCPRVAAPGLAPLLTCHPLSRASSSSCSTACSTGRSGSTSRGSSSGKSHTRTSRPPRGPPC